MPTCEPQETPFSSASLEPVDAWSRAVFERLSTWPLVQESGRWLRYEPGYLVLRIERVGGADIDPVIVDIANEEIAVIFGGWHTLLPWAGVTEDDEDPAFAAAGARDLIAQWIEGRVRTAIFVGEGGKQCGSVQVDPDDPDDPAAQLDALLANDEHLRRMRPTTVELRSAKLADWRRFSVRDGRIEATT